MPPARIRQLDSVRGLAVLAVFVHNSGTDIPLLRPLRAEGWMGVDLFFVLSGFLITGILLDTRGRDGYFRNFYGRRALRIWPLYYSALFFILFVLPRIHPADASLVFSPRSSPHWAYLLFLQNFFVPVPTAAFSLLAVTWSLAVEELFYLFWPCIVRLCSRRQLLTLACAVIGISPILRYFAVEHGVLIYSNPFCRLDGLMCGAVLALMVRSGRLASSRYVLQAWSMLACSLALAVFLDLCRELWLGFSFVAIAALCLVYLALFSEQKWFRLVLTNRALVYTGTVSYGMYLLEKIPLGAVKEFHLDGHSWFALSLALAATYGIASFSWIALEQPFLHLKRYFEFPVAPPARQPDPLVNVT